MSNPAPPRPTRPRPTPPGAAAARSRPAPWGWLEWTLVAQTAIPALLFVPGLSSIRIVTRIGSYGVVLLAWAAVGLLGRHRGGGSFPARPWLLFGAAYLALSILNPYTNSLTSGLAEATLVITIFSPVFWAGDAITSPRQVPRLLAILLVCNGLSALVGVGQVYQPERFNPPKINIVTLDEGLANSLNVVDDSGRKVMRPCGLTDSPGAAAGAGQIAAVAGLCWALAPIPFWKRGICLGLALTGLMAIFFSQVRSMLVVTVLCFLILVILLALQRDFRRAALLGGGGAGVVLGGFAVAITVMGKAVTARVESLFASNAAEVYHNSRGGFLQDTFERVLPDFPLGAGLGRWGMMYAYFGDHAAPLERGPLWCEIQWSAWVVDGGAPLLIAYVGATAVAMADSLRIALTSRDRTLSYWAAVIIAMNLGALSWTFSYPVFVAPAGIQFWVLAAALHAADRLDRRAGAGPRPLPARPRGGAATAPAAPGGPGGT